MSGEMLGLGSGKLPDDPHRLTDGGVYDNTGFEKAISILKEENLNNYLIVVSDASGPFRSDPSQTFGQIFSLASRSVDVLMNRISEKITELMKSQQNFISVLRISINDANDKIDHTGAPLAIETRRRLGLIRTDLDKFSDYEVGSLIWHGEGLADRDLP